MNAKKAMAPEASKYTASSSAIKQSFFAVYFVKSPFSLKHVAHGAV